MLFALENSPRDDDSRLAKRAAAGDSEAFASLVDKYQKLVFNAAYAVLGNREDAEDTAQETFLKAYRSLSSFRGECKFSTWLYRICVNTARDSLRAAQHRPKTQTPQWTDEDGEEREYSLSSAPEEAEPETLLEQREQARAVRGAIGALTPDHRQILTLRDMAGYSYEEIAQMLSIGVGTVKSRINRARSEVKKILTERNFFEQSTSNEPKKRK